MSLHGNETPGRPPAAGEMLGARARRPNAGRRRPRKYRPRNSGSGLCKRRQIQGLGRPKPKHVFGVVLDTVTGVGMGKNGQAVALFDEPRDHLPEELGPERQLAATPRMGAYRLIVHAPDHDGKGSTGGLAKRLGLLSAGSIKIDMRMIADDGTHVALLILANAGKGPPTSCLGSGLGSSQDLDRKSAAGRFGAVGPTSKVAG